MKIVRDELLKADIKTEGGVYLQLKNYNKSDQ